jgi:hypothetical protein
VSYDQPPRLVVFVSAAGEWPAGVRGIPGRTFRNILSLRVRLCHQRSSGLQRPDTRVTPGTASNAASKLMMRVTP